LRLGREKAIEKIGQQSLIKRVIDCISSVSQSVLVVTSQEQLELIGNACSEERVVLDLYPGRAALGGIYTGLMSSKTPYNVVVGCDMPFLNCKLLQYLIDVSGSFDAVVPMPCGMYEPLHAVYSKSCLNSVEHLLSQDVGAISQLFNLVKTRYVDDAEINAFDPEHMSFFNINTQDDLKKAKFLIRQMEVTMNEDKVGPSID